jgi:hypothetical protein
LVKIVDGCPHQNGGDQRSQDRGLAGTYLITRTVKHSKYEQKWNVQEEL